MRAGPNNPVPPADQPSSGTPIPLLAGWNPRSCYRPSCCRPDPQVLPASWYRFRTWPWLAAAPIRPSATFPRKREKAALGGPQDLGNSRSAGRPVCEAFSLWEKVPAGRMRAGPNNPVPPADQPSLEPPIPLLAGCRIRGLAVDLLAIELLVVDLILKCCRSLGTAVRNWPWLAAAPIRPSATFPRRREKAALEAHKTWETPGLAGRPLVRPSPSGRRCPQGG